MLLDRGSRIETRWPFAASVPGLTGASLWLAGAWHPATVDTETSEVVLMLAGPEVDAELLPHPPGTVVLPVGQHWPKVRLADNPEVIIDAGGVILVT